jgi:hypothetical protein
MSDAADIPANEGKSAEDDAKARSLASRKFNFEDIVNADPRCPLPALKIVRAYLRFISDFEKGTAYVSILDLQVATGLSPHAIIAGRNKLIQLGYFVPDGKTGAGAVRYRLSFAPENRVLDHVMIARETLKQIDAERKEKQRQKRQASAAVTEPDAVTPDEPVTEAGAGPEGFVPCTGRRPVTEAGAGNYLYEYLEEDSSEEEGYTQRVSPPVEMNTYALASGGDPHVPYPVPDSEEELERMLAQLTRGFLPGVVVFFRRQFVAGQLTPAMVEQQRRLAS